MLACGYHNGMFADEPADTFTTATMATIVAVHEAGHAVAGFALGLGVDRISLT